MITTVVEGPACARGGRARRRCEERALVDGAALCAALWGMGCPLRWGGRASSMNQTGWRKRMPTHEPRYLKCGEGAQRSKQQAAAAAAAAAAVPGLGSSQEGTPCRRSPRWSPSSGSSCSSTAAPGRPPRPAPCRCHLTPPRRGRQVPRRGAARRACGARTPRVRRRGAEGRPAVREGGRRECSAHSIAQAHPSAGRGRASAPRPRRPTPPPAATARARARPSPRTPPRAPRLPPRPRAPPQRTSDFSSASRRSATTRIRPISSSTSGFSK
jgi:hypothetical protein